MRTRWCTQACNTRGDAVRTGVLVLGAVGQGKRRSMARGVPSLSTSPATEGKESPGPAQPHTTEPSPRLGSGRLRSHEVLCGLTHSLVYAQIHTDTGGMQQAPAPLGHSYSISRLRKNSLSSFLVALVSVSLLETQPARLPAAGASPTALCLTPSSQGRAKVPLGEGTKGKKAPEKSPGQPPLLPTARNRRGALRDLKGFAMQ